MREKIFSQLEKNICFFKIKVYLCIKKTQQQILNLYTMNTITILKCRLEESETSSYKILDFKVYDSEDSAIKKMEDIASNLTNAGKKWNYIDKGMGISCQLTENYYPRQEWVVYQELIRSY